MSGQHDLQEVGVDSLFVFASASRSGNVVRTWPSLSRRSVAARSGSMTVFMSGPRCGGRRNGGYHVRTVRSRRSRSNVLAVLVLPLLRGSVPACSVPIR